MGNIHHVQVLWPDCDPAGILFNVNYYRWMDDATFHLFEMAGLPWDELKAKYGAPGTPLVASHADFRSPAKFRDKLTIESEITEWGNSSFKVSHVFRIGDRLAAEGWERRIWCKANPGDPAKIKPAPIPDEVRKALGG
jgi:4-hydroxybenzoyl-CoA thioesterase